MLAAPARHRGPSERYAQDHASAHPQVGRCQRCPFAEAHPDDMCSLADNRRRHPRDRERLGKYRRTSTPGGRSIAREEKESLRRTKYRAAGILRGRVKNLPQVPFHSQSTGKPSLEEPLSGFGIRQSRTEPLWRKREEAGRHDTRAPPGRRRSRGNKPESETIAGHPEARSGRRILTVGRSPVPAASR